jgi:hypothetical protein
VSDENQELLELEERAVRAAEIAGTPSKVEQAVLDAVALLGAQGVFHEYQKKAVASRTWWSCWSSRRAGGSGLPGPSPATT